MGVQDRSGAILSIMIERRNVPPVRQQNGATLEPAINPNTDKESDYWRCHCRQDLPINHDYAMEYQIITLAEKSAERERGTGMGLTPLLASPPTLRE